MKVNILGAGLAGLSCAYECAQHNIACRLISIQASERAQSVMAEGGINGACNTMGEEDCPQNHIRDTLKAGCHIADAEAVAGMCTEAPELIEWLAGLGVPFNRNQDGTLSLRNFGGQKKKRTAYAQSSTGKQIMSTLIDAVRRYESNGLVERFCHHAFAGLILEEHICKGICLQDDYTGEMLAFAGPVVLCAGGLGGLFAGKTTGTTANDASVQSICYLQGVEMGNLEMIQYHPTTITLPGKRGLVSEAARGEGGRLFIPKNGENYYFMEEGFELGNLAPRDVISREIYFLLHSQEPGLEKQVYLDLRNLPGDVWKKKLSDLRAELIHYLNTDPKKTPIPVEPGIHYFMGGIHVNRNHETNIPGLYAAGECCDQYHGANRLGGNSLLGALYGGRRAGRQVSAQYDVLFAKAEDWEINRSAVSAFGRRHSISPSLQQKIGEILYSALGIARNEEDLTTGIKTLEKLQGDFDIQPKTPEYGYITLGLAMLESACYRRESRGAHYRSDYPALDEAYRGIILAEYHEDSKHKVTLRFQKTENPTG